MSGNVHPEYQKLIDSLVRSHYLKSPKIIRAFLKVDRAHFVPQAIKHQAYWNVPLAIGYGQTISQPLTVAFMLERLQPQRGEKILDVGSGSGWQAALLAEIVGPKGQVFALEIIPQLKTFGENNVKKLKYKNVKFYLAKRDVLGLASHSPFDRIIVAASAKTLPQSLVEQLKPGGRMVLPINYSLWQIDKTSTGQIKKHEFPGFAFVPLV